MIDGPNWAVAAKPRAPKAPKAEPTQAEVDAECEAQRKADGMAILAAMRVPAPKPRGPVVEPDTKQGETLMNEIDTTLERYILSSGAVRTVTTLWIGHTYVHDALTWTPYLMVASPMAGCGKSTLRMLMEEMSRNGMYVNSPSGPFVYRTVHCTQPSLMIDEWDALTPEAREAFTAILNSGTHYKGNVGRCQGEQNKPTVFRTYCPKAIFGIGGTRLPASTQSRVIDITLQRAVPEDQLGRFKAFEAPALRARLEAWGKSIWNWACVHNVEEFNSPTLRSRDVWEPLFLVADACGPVWQRRIREAMHEIVLNEEPPEPEALRLLNAVAKAFEVRNEPFMSGADLLVDDGVRLCAKNPHALAMKLRLFGIRPSLRRLADKVARVYAAEDLKGPLSRYVPAPAPPL